MGWRIWTGGSNAQVISYLDGTSASLSRGGHGKGKQGVHRDYRLHQTQPGCAGQQGRLLYGTVGYGGVG